MKVTEDKRSEQWPRKSPAIGAATLLPQAFVDLFHTRLHVQHLHTTIAREALEQFAKASAKGGFALAWWGCGIPGIPFVVVAGQ